MHTTQPTDEPIKVPSTQLANTIKNASQKYKTLILVVVIPIERSTPNSLADSKRFADMFVESAKKHKNIVINMIVSKINANNFAELFYQAELDARLPGGFLVLVKLTFRSKNCLEISAIIAQLVLGFHLTLIPQYEIFSNARLEQNEYIGKLNIQL